MLCKLLLTCCVVCLSYFVLPAQQVEDFEDIEAVTKKGFFPTYFKGLFKDFFVADPSWDMNGGLNFSMRSYTALGATERQDPFFYTLGANVNTRLWKVQLPLSVVITARNTMANYPKPKELIAAFKDDLEARKNRFVRIGISPRYKWIKLHFGHRNMNFSQFSISNLTYLGMGFEMTPGKVRIAGISGRLAKAVPLDISLISNIPPAFTRKAEAIKVGYGSPVKLVAPEGRKVGRVGRSVNKESLVDQIRGTLCLWEEFYGWFNQFKVIRV